MAQRRKKSTPKTVDTRLRALRSDIDTLTADMKGLAGDVGDVADERIQKLMRAAEHVAERALHLAEEATTQFTDDVETWANDNLESARESVRAHPLLAIGLSIGLGALFGATLLRR